MRETDGRKLIAFAERFCPITLGARAGQPMKLAPFQRQLLIDLASSRARTGYIQMPRKNGKSTLGAILALHGLCADGERGSQVYSVAGAREQAKIVFSEAARMVELGPLRRSLQVLRTEIRHRASGSVYKALAAEAGLAEGLNPHLVIADEIHVLGSRRDLWDVMALGMGGREKPLMLGITTPGVRYGRDGRDSFAYTLYQYAQQVASGEVDDPSFFSAVWEAPDGCDTTDPEAWALSNPALDLFLSRADMAALQRTTPENEFRTKRLGQWVSASDAWLPEGAWDACPRAAELEDGAKVILGFDGSKSRDATALVAATITARPALHLLRVWERGPWARHDWQVPRGEVTQAVLDACERFQVRELVGDRALWVSELQEWAQLGVPVVEVSQSPTRMVPATQRMFEAVVTGELEHDHSPTLARHVGNATIRPNGQIGKETKDSLRKIDAAVAGVMAYDRACTLGKARKRRPVYIK